MQHSQLRSRVFLTLLLDTLAPAGGKLRATGDMCQPRADHWEPISARSKEFQHMAQNHSIDTPLRRVTKPEACQILQVSLSTLNRRIAEGQLEVERVQQGQGHRVFVLMPADTDRPEAPDEAGPDAGTQLAVVLERIKNLEDMVKLQKEWLDLSESRVQQLLRALPEPTSPVAPSTPPLPTPPAARRARWKFW